MVKDTNYFLQNEKYIFCWGYKYTARKKELSFSCTLCVRQLQKILV